MGGRVERRFADRLVKVIVSVVLLISALGIADVEAQNTVDLEDPHPLRPADTSSPRATLRTFLANAEEMIRAWRQDKMTPASLRAYQRAADTLDFSATANGNSSAVRTERILLLKELLNRVEVPPDEEIPGTKEVARGNITIWAIPDTKISIARIDDGPRAGAFVFSADTVERLHRFYRMAKHLPYWPGATAGIYETWVASALTSELAVTNRLKPIDTSSPRSTVLGFLNSITRAYKIVMEADAALTSVPPTMTIEEARKAERNAGDLLQRALLTLDLSHVPEAFRQDVGIETIIRLKEVFDRLQLPPADSIPDAGMTGAARQGLNGAFLQTAGPLRWRYPNTKIEIIEMTAGERQGEFLFSADTVNRVGEFFSAIEDLPYRMDNNAAMAFGYGSFEVTDGFLNYYISTPGFLIAPAHFLGRFVDTLPAALKALHAGQTGWQWAGLGLVALAALYGSYLLFRIISVTTRGLDSPLGSWLRVLPPVFVALGVRAATDFVDQDLNLTGEVLVSIRFISGAIVLFLVAWAIWRGFLAIAVTITATPRISDRGLDASLVRITSGLLAIFVAIAVVITGLRDLGVDAVPLIAGLGVGGLAVALAIRPTLENLIGGIILFTDKPIRIGDFCSFGGMTGTVEKIGVRSTQIRGLDRTLISIPNAKFADMELINWAQCDRMLISVTIGLRYETEDDQLRHVLAKIREMLHAHPKIDRETVRVRFAGYGASSLDIGVRIYALTRDWNEFHAIREDVFFRIKAIVSASGTGFAFPSQTLYLGRDDGLDQDRTDEALTEVERWRDTGELPFPNMRSRRMDELAGTLDYPPRGSVAIQAQEQKAAERLSADEEVIEPSVKPK